MIYELFQFSKLSMKSIFSVQSLERTPEPENITEGIDAVSEFENVEKNSYSIVYGLLLDYIYRIRPTNLQNAPLIGLDLGSGPGTCANLITHYLNYSKVIGVDLSDPMLELSRKKISLLGAENKIEFKKGDFTSLTDFSDNSFDLVYSLNAFHHLPTHGHVVKAMEEADRVCRPEGIVIILDLQRPKTKKIANDYLDWVGLDVKKKGLNAHYKDFYHSIFAAWTDEEFISTISSFKKRSWFHVQTFGFSPQQFIVGVPTTQSKLFLRKGMDKKLKTSLIPLEFRDLWSLTVNAFNYSKIKKIGHYKTVGS